LVIEFCSPAYPRFVDLREPPRTMAVGIHPLDGTRDGPTSINGWRAGVPDAHPHRYRDSFAVDMLARGASPYRVAKLLGDTVATIEKHYPRL